MAPGPGVNPSLAALQTPKQELPCEARQLPSLLPDLMPPL